jgi:hypothetical protein
LRRGEQAYQLNKSLLQNIKFIEMLENLIQLVKENAAEAITNNSAIPNSSNESAITDTATSIFEGLKSQVQDGNMGGLIDIVKNSGSVSAIASNPIVQNIVKSLASSLAAKYGVDAASSNGIASDIVPNVLSQLISKAKDPNDSSFDLQGVMSSLGAKLDLGTIMSMAGGGGGLLGGLGKLFG